VLDFTSSLYLGLLHDSRSLAPWGQLTTGVPAALAPPPGASAVAARLSTLQGCERGTLAASTLHLCIDLFGQLAVDRPTILVDAGSYPIARLGVELAAARGARVTTFARHDVAALRRALRAAPPQPVVLADGYTPGVGPAPVRAYLENARERGGLLVLDDTQALGLLGAEGGGSLREHGVGGTDVVLVSSLAKGFGAPIAALSGAHALVRHFEAHSATRVHCSPPSIAALRAAARALEINERCGEGLRRRLAAVVRRLRNGLAGAGLHPRGGLFPVQVLGPPDVPDPAQAHERLRQLGVACVLRRDALGGPPELAFVLTVRHAPSDVDRAVAAVVHATGARRPSEVAA
jgi:8-amino-7-oxononanoate synthase